MSFYPAELENAPPLTLRQPVLYADIDFDVGPTNGRFFAALRDEGRILATRCAACARVYVPPRINCHDCFAEMRDWIEVGPGGVLESFTVVRQPGMLQPAAPPYLLGLVRLDGADTALVHRLGGIEPAAARIGMRVRAMLAGQRQGNIHDIRCFEPET